MDTGKILKNILKSPVKHKEEIILSHVKDKTVLDIGCVGQDNSYENPNWLHNKLKATASKVIGVDVNKPGIDALTKHGYTIKLPKELEESKEEFDCLVMADVIEHVDNLVEFINYYSQFLNESGKMIVTTPNPFSIRRVVSILLYKEPGANPEHTVWLDPYNVLELVHRTNTKLNDIFWLHEYLKPKKLRYKILFPIFRILYTIRKYYSPNFGFILSK